MPRSTADALPTPTYVAAMGTGAGEAATVHDLLDAGKECQAQGEWDRAIELFQAALARAAGEDTVAARVVVLRALGTIHNQRGDRAEARRFQEQALALAEAHMLRAEEAAALNSLAAIAQHTGDLATAESLYRRARRVAQDAGDDRRAAMVDQNLGILSNIRGSFASALTYYQSALTRYRMLGDTVAASWVLNNLGMLHVDRDEFREGERCYDEAADLARANNDSGVFGMIELNRAELYLRRGRFEDARRRCESALLTFTRSRSKPGQGEAYRLLGMMYRESERPHLAEIHFGLALRCAEDATEPLLQAETLREWALVHLEQRRSREAVKTLNRSHQLFNALGARREVADLERRLERLHESYVQAVSVWGAEAIESKDPYTAGHSCRVTDLACRLGAAVGLSAVELETLRIGALVHDVGKTVIPAEVLTKPAKLDEDEWALMREHPSIGDEIIKGLDFPYDISAIVRHHHEHWDGHGYPDRLAGEAIPLMARIVTVADVYDALTSRRSYRGACTHDDALAIMRREAGTVLDPSLLPVFEAMLAEETGPRPGDARHAVR